MNYLLTAPSRYTGADILTPNPYQARTTYGPAVIPMTVEYLQSCEDVDDIVIRSEGSSSTSYENRIKTRVPTLQGLAVHLCVSTSTIGVWAQEYSEFGDLVETLKNIQADKLINGGLSNRYNATIAKLLLARHGYRDSAEVEHTGVSPILVEFIEK